MNDLGETVFSEAHSNAQAVLRRLEECREIDASQREALVACLAEAGERSVLTKLLGKVKDAQTLVSLPKLFQDVNPTLRAALLEREQDGGETLQQTESTKEGEMLTARLLGCREELIQSVTQLSPIIEFLEAAEEGFLTASEKRAVLDCCEGNIQIQREAINNLLKKLEEEKTLKAESLVRLLGGCEVIIPWSPPSARQLIVATSESTATEIILQHSKLISEAIRQRADLKGLAPQEAGLTEAVKELMHMYQWKGKDLFGKIFFAGFSEQVPSRKGETEKLLSISAQKESSDTSLKSALSTAQEKTVQAIKICQLLCNVHMYFPDLQPVMQELGHVHMEHCQVARGKQIQCKGCTEVKSTKKELEKHQLEVHGAVGMAKKKKRVGDSRVGKMGFVLGPCAHAVKKAGQYNKLCECHVMEMQFSLFLLPH
ncbi:Zinc finger and BTB domain-containing protein 40 isoform X4 [Aix galericulata]|nr:Zinc finger and BTB domain-containing protein 40 isoform X4 [Aix galericulata]